MRRLWSSNISIIISAKANLRVALFPQINSGEEGYFPILPPDGTDVSVKCSGGLKVTRENERI